MIRGDSKEYELLKEWVGTLPFFTELPSSVLTCEIGVLVAHLAPQRKVVLIWCFSSFLFPFSLLSSWSRLLASSSSFLSSRSLVLQSADPSWISWRCFEAWGIILLRIILYRPARASASPCSLFFSSSPVPSSPLSSFLLLAPR